MESSIIEVLLHLIKERYTPKRLEATKRRLQNLWDLQPMTDRVPYVLYGMPLKQPPELTDDMSGDERGLIHQLQAICEHAEWRDDYVPGMSPGIDQVMLPAYFGCSGETSPMTVRIKPAVRDPHDVYSLPKLGFGPETLCGRMLGRMRYFQREVKGLLPIYEADLQGPFSVASQVWGIEDFLAAVYEHPDEVHHLLSLCTDALIEFAKLMRDAVNGDWIPYHCAPAVWLPQERGIAVSEDLLAVVSPRIMREFILPYCERIADEFGGIFLHSCGSINHVIGELNQMRGLIGLNFSSSETDLPHLAANADSCLILTVHNSPVSCMDLPILDVAQHVELCGSVFRENHVQGLCLVFGAVNLSSQEIESALVYQ